MSQKNKRPFALVLLCLLQFLLGVSAVICGALFIYAPDGSIIQIPLSQLDGSPFQNFLIPGVILCLFVGVFPLCVAFSLWKKPGWNWPNAINPFKSMHWSWAGSLAAAAILVIWLSVELFWIDYSMLHTICYSWAAILLLLSLSSPVRRYSKLYKSKRGHGHTNKEPVGE